MNAPVALRSFADRCRQVLLFELGGLLLITPPFVWLSGVPLADSVLLLVVCALVAALWNGVYNTLFDWVEARLAGRSADKRPIRLRVVHAFGFELGLLVMTLPIMVWLTGLGWTAALLADVGLVIAYVSYAFVFNLLYDRVFPIQQKSRALGEAVAEH